MIAMTGATFALLLVVAPVNALACLVGYVRGRVPSAQQPSGAPSARQNPKTVLLSGGKMTKALQLARSFHRAGHRVVLVESARYRLSGHRFSRCVDRFYIVPDPGDAGYAEALLDIVQREGVDVFVPVSSPAASLHDAEAKALLLAHCEVIHVGADMLRLLDDKYEFATTAASLGLRVPDTHRITDPTEVAEFDFGRVDRAGRIYILKSIAYDPIRRLDLTPLPRRTAAETEAFARSLPISTENPWILQEFVVGQEYCTHGTVRNGNLQLYCCCESSAFQINYEMVHKPEIEAWVRTFVNGLGLTGQVSLDFIEANDGTLYAIECNPRTHSAITMFYDQPNVAAGYLADLKDTNNGVATVIPTQACKPTYWLYHELWRMVTHPSTAAERVQVVWRGKDAIFDRHDPLPFFMVHHVHIPSLLIDNLRRLHGWVRIDFNIGKLVEPGGD
jgi:predicted ATP-grasp superfamily ATP-dependent carboligase